MDATYPELVDDVTAQAPPGTVLDGEIVAFDGPQTSFHPAADWQAVVVSRIDVDKGRTDLARRFGTTLRIAGTGQHGMTEIDEPPGRLIAETLVGSGDDHDCSLRQSPARRERGTARGSAFSPGQELFMFRVPDPIGRPQLGMSRKAVCILSGGQGSACGMTRPRRAQLEQADHRRHPCFAGAVIGRRCPEHGTTQVALLRRFRGHRACRTDDNLPVCGWSALPRSRVAHRPLERVVGHLLPARLDTGEV